MTTPPGAFNWGALMDQVGAGFTPLPVGEYDVVVDTAEATQSTTQKTMFKVRFKVESGPHAGRIVYNNFTISPENANALRFFFQHMGAMGLTREFFAGNPTPQQVADALLGRRCRIGVKHRTYQGTLRENVDKIVPATGTPQFAQPQVPSPGTPGPAPQVPPTPTPPAPAPAPAPVTSPPPAPAPVPPPAPASPPAPPQQEQATSAQPPLPPPPPVPF